MKMLQQLVKGKEQSLLRLALCSAAIGIGISVLVLPSGELVSGEEKAGAESFHVLGPKTVDVLLKRVYLDGEVGEEKLSETIWSMEDFWAFYEDWTLVEQSEKALIFQQEINDISPILKIEGYFGISDDGFLQIYQGEPDNEQIIQSFFSIDTKKLKSREHIELVKGIPVKNKENYEEILAAFSQYQVEEI